MTDVGGGLIFFFIWVGFLLLMFGGIIAAIWALVDLLNKPEWAWEYAGENRTTYIVLLAASFFVCQFLAWIPALMYFKGAKPKIVRVMQSMPPPVVPGPYAGYGNAPYPGQQYAGQQYPGQPGAYGQPGPYGQAPAGQWPASQPQTGAGPVSQPPAGYPSPGQGVPQPQGDPGTDEWWKQPGATPPPG